MGIWLPICWPKLPGHVCVRSFEATPRFVASLPCNKMIAFSFKKKEKKKK